MWVVDVLAGDDWAAWEPHLSGPIVAADSQVAGSCPALLRPLGVALHVNGVRPEMARCFRRTRLTHIGTKQTKRR